MVSKKTSPIPFGANFHGEANLQRLKLVASPRRLGRDITRQNPLPELAASPPVAAAALVLWKITSKQNMPGCNLPLFPYNRG